MQKPSKLLPDDLHHLMATNCVLPQVALWGTRERKSEKPFPGKQERPAQRPCGVKFVVHAAHRRRRAQVGIFRRCLRTSGAKPNAGIKSASLRLQKEISAVYSFITGAEFFAGKIKQAD